MTRYLDRKTKHSQHFQKKFPQYFHPPPPPPHPTTYNLQPTSNISAKFEQLKPALPLTNLLHPAFKLISLEEDDEDTFINLVTSARILKWSFNLSLLEEHITTTGTPQKTLKRRYSLTSYHSSNKSTSAQ